MKSPLSPLMYFRRTASVYRDRPAVIDGAARFTYGEFCARCLRLGAGLRAHGIRAGDRVAVLAANSHRALECYTAVPVAGAILVPLNTRLSGEDYGYILSHAGCRLLLAEPEFAAAASALVERIPSLEAVWLADAEAARAAGAGGRPWSEELIAGAPGAAARALLDAIGRTDEASPITINYTSGTTARPKGVILTHRNAALNVLNLIAHARLTVDDVYLHTLPMFHVNGWGGVWALAAVGATQVCLPRPDPARIVRAIDEHGVTVAFAAPTVLVMLGGDPATAGWHPKQAVRWYVGGAPPPAALIQRIEGELGFEIVHVYGLTETSPWLTVCEWRAEWNGLPLERRAAIKARQGIGQVAAGEVRVVRPDLSDVARDGREVGEVVARGPVVTAGYYNDPRATEEAFAGGWFHTGDLAVMHPDGYLEIVDRKKDMILSGGENISSLEVEGVLYRHPAVLEAAVVAAPDPLWGEVPRACVVLRPGAAATADELREWCRARLAHFKAPKIVEILDALPKTSTGKIQKYVLRGRSGG